VSTWIRLEHVLASSSIPLLFPPVDIDGELYCDGGLRQMVPLAPALHLGATHLLVIDPLAAPVAASPTDEMLRREAVASPLYLAGKALNALFVDRLEVDLARVDQLTAILRAGERRFGPAFAAELNAELRAAGGRPIAPVSTLRLSPSVDVAHLAADYATSGEFAARVRGAAAHVLRHLASAGATRAGDLLAYLLFDGGFAAALIDLGRADARAHRDELVALFGAQRSQPQLPALRT
jgi:NTE family protein